MIAACILCRRPTTSRTEYITDDCERIRYRCETHGDVPVQYVETSPATPLTPTPRATEAHE